MSVPDIVGMPLSRALVLMEEHQIRCSVEEIRPPRDRRDEDAKGEPRVLRVRECPDSCCALIVCRV